MKYTGKHWRITTLGMFSFNIDRIPFCVEYRTIFGLWRKVPSRDQIGYLCFLTEKEAIKWIIERAPKSMTTYGEDAIMKPADWNDLEFASGRYGAQKQAAALIRLATSRSQQEGASS